MTNQSAVASYQSVKTHASAEAASPHKLIEMLFDGALERISQAKGAIEYGQIEMRNNKINSAISVVGGLRESLDHDTGGEISANLDGLYVYVQNTLSKANRANDGALLDEAAALLGEIRSAWVQIA